MVTYFVHLSYEHPVTGGLARARYEVLAGSIAEAVDKARERLGDHAARIVRVVATKGGQSLDQ